MAKRTSQQSNPWMMMGYSVRTTKKKTRGEIIEISSHQQIHTVNQAFFPPHTEKTSFAKCCNLLVFCHKQCPKPFKPKTWDQRPHRWHKEFTATIIWLCLGQGLDWRHQLTKLPFLTNLQDGIVSTSNLNLQEHTLTAPCSHCPPNQCWTLNLNLAGHQIHLDSHHQRQFHHESPKHHSGNPGTTSWAHKWIPSAGAKISILTEKHSGIQFVDFGYICSLKATKKLNITCSSL